VQEVAHVEGHGHAADWSLLVVGAVVHDVGPDGSFLRLCGHCTGDIFPIGTKTHFAL
jgi:hypothetical protein